MQTIFIGVDPGTTGGIAALTEAGGVWAVVKMPATNAEILDVFRALKVSGEVKAYIEQVHTMPKQGIVSAFTFGKGLGGLHMALAACLIPFDEVAPGKWQKVMQCSSKGDKNVTKRRALELFPTIKVTHAIADALLIAEYGRRQERPTAW